MTMPANDNRAVRYLRGVMIAAALILPLFSLAVLGTLWLWQNGAIIIWSVLAAIVALLIYAGERWLVKRSERAAELPIHADVANEAAAGEDPGWSTRDKRAFAVVEDIANRVTPESLNSRDAILALGAEVVEAVAREMHPGEKDPLWKFTVPEALALVARVSAQLNRFVTDNVPLSDRLTVARLRTIYRWRSLSDTAEKAYDLWRILRLMNPATAIATELREKVSGRLITGLRTEITRRVARAYVREVGRAAIDLYSNRLRSDFGPHAPSPADTEASAQAPIRLLLAGQGGSGKSSLVNALSGAVKAAADILPAREQGAAVYELHREDELFGHLIDMPGLSPDERSIAQLVEQATSSDVVLWVISALRPDRAIDSEALDAVRSAFETRIELRPPPLIVVVTHIDRLRPFDEWHPPYDLASDGDAKSRSIRQAVEATAADLRVEREQIVPICIGLEMEPYNIDVLWARLMEAVPAAVNAQLVRRLSLSGRASVDWKRTWRQAVNAGRVLGRTVLDA